MNKEALKIKVYCPSCKEKIAVGYTELDINYNTFSINTKCEHCDYKIELFYDQGDIMKLINKGLLEDEED